MMILMGLHSSANDQTAQITGFINMFNLRLVICALQAQTVLQTRIYLKRFLVFQDATGGQYLRILLVKKYELGKVFSFLVCSRIITSDGVRGYTEIYRMFHKPVPIGEKWVG